ncbi:cysteine dioxygenase [Nocardioides stalactiti]|uniref:cysteine dioxygenase n=1 Tax=Nocardioides stalactiti TaxID=2755356 RepID=UPI0016031810|nr:cysteine dioxygenase family protein [Nocardioides stalactiti]
MSGRSALAALPLLEVVRGHAADPALLQLLDPCPEERSWIRLVATEDHELWLISWPAGAATDWHDHGSSSGAFTVLRGTLTEHTFDGGLQLVDHGVGGGKAFAAGYAHDVRNHGEEPALSLHAYSPRLTTMTRFKFHGDRLEVLGVERAGEEW